MSRRTQGGGWDLSDQMNSEAVASAFSKLVSGKPGYKTIIEKKIEPIKCKNCGYELYGDEKFCPECGTKVERIDENKK